MKKIILITILALFLVSLVNAQQVAIIDAGAKPGDLFYGLDVAFDKMQIALTFNKIKKADVILNKMEERIAEIEALAKEEEISNVDNTEEIEEVTLIYHNHHLIGLQNALQNVDNVVARKSIELALERKQEQLTTLKEIVKTNEAKVRLEVESESTKDVKEASEKGTENMKKAEESENKNPEDAVEPLGY